MATTHSSANSEQIGPLGVFEPPDISIECPAFSGSLGLLFQFVRDHKVDLIDIPLAPICTAYTVYLVERGEQDLESAAVALVALSYLLERKAWRLVPGEAVPALEDLDLIDDVEPYVQEFRPAIEALLERRSERDFLYFRSGEPANASYELPFDTSDVQPVHLAAALSRLLARAKPDTIEPLGRPRRSLSEQMIVVLKALPLEFASLDAIVTGEFTRSEVVWWFLALLELIRLGQARVKLEADEPLFARGVAS